MKFQPPISTDSFLIPERLLLHRSDPEWRSKLIEEFGLFIVGWLYNYNYNNNNYNNDYNYYNNCYSYNYNYNYNNNNHR